MKAILAARGQKNIDPLLNHRQEAEQVGDWESVRDVDFWILKFAFEESRFKHLMFGTPHPAYRKGERGPRRAD